MNRCVGCHQQIPSDLAFCPTCGEDNRAPEKRCNIAPHVHNFSQGDYCSVCGESYNHEGRKAPEHGYVFRNFAALGIVWIALFVILMLAVGPRHRMPIISIPVALGCAGVILLVGLLIQSKVLIDLDKQEVRFVAGLWPFMYVRRHAFAEIRGIGVSIRVIYNRYSTSQHYRVSLILDGESGFLHEYTNPEPAYDKARELSTALNVPVSDTTGMQSSWY